MMQKDSLGLQGEGDDAGGQRGGGRRPRVGVGALRLQVCGDLSGEEHRGDEVVGVRVVVGCSGDGGGD